MSSANRKYSSRIAIGAVAVLAVVVGLFEVQKNGRGDRGPHSSEEMGAPGIATEQRAQGGIDAIMEAFRVRRSGVIVEVAGMVQRVLPDDDEGSRHQRFILELSNEHTLLVAHNIDLAMRVPLAVGDSITLHGQYEWNERGGLVHWTHHDPQDRREGGWVRHDGRIYR